MNARTAAGPTAAASAATTLFTSGDPTRGEVTIVVPLYANERFLLPTLDCLLAQDLADLQLVIVDDRGPGEACATALEWLVHHGNALGGARLLQHPHNLGGAVARNTGVAASSSEFLFMLDADNILFPGCLSRLLAALRVCGAAFAYPIMEVFGDEEGLMNLGVWDSERLKYGNYIDMLALFHRDAWLAVGGQTEMDVAGWNDYELWCKFVEHGLWGVQVPQVLARYRVHKGSNLRTITNKPNNLKRLIPEMMRLHPWLRLPVLSGGGRPDGND